MWVGYMTLEYVSSYYVGPSNKVSLFVYYSYYQLDTWKFGWSYTPNIGIIIHPSIIR